MLDRETFLDIVKKTPLVSVDLVLVNSRDEMLLGLRKNEPARNFWFVPGGRVAKDERIADAFERVALDELGMRLCYKDSRFMGFYEHMYETNFARVEGVSTHYIVLAHEIRVGDPTIAADAQHEQYKWFDKETALGRDNVHPNTKIYFSHISTALGEAD